MEPKLHKISAVLKCVFNASLSKILVEDLTFHDSKSEFTQPRYNLKSGRSSHRCSWIYHLKAKNPSSLKLNTDRSKPLVFQAMPSLVLGHAPHCTRVSSPKNIEMMITDNSGGKRLWANSSLFWTRLICSCHLKWHASVGTDILIEFSKKNLLKLSKFGKAKVRKPAKFPGAGIPITPISQIPVL